MTRQIMPPADHSTAATTPAATTAAATGAGATSATTTSSKAPKQKKNLHLSLRGAERAASDEKHHQSTDRSSLRFDMMTPAEAEILHDDWSAAVDGASAFLPHALLVEHLLDSRKRHSLAKFVD